MLKINLKIEHYKFNFKHLIHKNIGKKQIYCPTIEIAFLLNET